MKQIVQNLSNGTIKVVDVPAPQVRRRHVLVETRRTLISAGTERMLLNFGRANLLQKALQQPDKVKQTLEKMRTDGFAATLETVRSKLGQPLPLGYCNAGIVAELGEDVRHVKVGDRVVTNGPHAEMVSIGRNLVAKIPANVSDDEACFTPLAAIALQGIRLAQPQLGESFCVMGLGLVGLLAVQLLRAHGCQVIATDFSSAKLELARQFGAITVNLSVGEDPVATALSATGGFGIDGVIIAAATKSDEPVSQAAEMCRKRGRIVLVGVTGLNLSRDDFYKKEISFQVSCSYGPGRYEPGYEERGEDYPIGFVRWTEQRNFDAVLAEMAAGRLNVKPLIADHTPIDRAAEAYDKLSDGSEFGLLIDYPERGDAKRLRTVGLQRKASAGTGPGIASVALFGAGNFGSRVTAPALAKTGARLHTIVSRNGLSVAIEGERAGFEQASSDQEAVLADGEVDTVVIATRHDSHAELTVKALRAGKHVFVEKPLGLTLTEIDAVEKAVAANEESGRPTRLMVGFNRRFSPFSIRMKQLLETASEPKCLIAIINAGAIPSDHWTQDAEQGGGRIIGEACHFIDLLRFFAGAPIVDVKVSRLGRPAADGIAADKATITAAFEDGSIGTLHYFANGPKSLVKERYEAFVAGRFLRLDNFKALEAIGWSRGASMKGRQDKGHAAALKAFVESVQGGKPAPIPTEELLEVSRWTIRAANGGA